MIDDEVQPSRAPGVRHKVRFQPLGEGLGPAF
jgi:hypothetical protein